VSVSASVIASLATTSTQSTPPEIYSPRFVTSLTAAILTGLRPTVISVAGTNTIYSQGTYSIAIYDAGTDASPVNFEALEVIGGGGTLNWTVVTESGWNSIAHANGSTVVATVFTPRSVQQPLVNHITVTATPDPHPSYVKKASYGGKGQILVGTGSSAYTNQAVGTDGMSLVADSTQTSGVKWVSLSLTSVLLHMGDLIVGALQGATARLPIGVPGEVLTAVQNSPTIADPISAPTCLAGIGSGALVNGNIYDFAYAWLSTPSPDGGITDASPRTMFTATTSGVVAVQCPASPLVGATLLVYAAVTGDALQLQGTLPNAAIGGTNTVNVASINTGAAPSGSNTTGGLSALWEEPFNLDPPRQANLQATTSLTANCLPAAFGPSGYRHGPGAVPDPGSLMRASRFLREDGQWQLAQSSVVALGAQTAVQAFPFVYPPTNTGSPAVASSGTIATTGLALSVVNPAGAVTGVILQAGGVGVQILTVVNIAAGGNAITFAAPGTSNVADGVASPLAGLTSRTFVWIPATALWYRAA
jgi:hypothetical protein